MDPELTCHKFMQLGRVKMFTLNFDLKIGLRSLKKFQKKILPTTIEGNFF